MSTDKERELEEKLRELERQIEERKRREYDRDDIAEDIGINESYQPEVDELDDDNPPNEE